MPQWIAEHISKSQAGTEIGYSHDVNTLLGESTPDSRDIRLVLTSAGAGTAISRPTEYGISLPNGAQNLRVFESNDTNTACNRVDSTLHMIPKRDAQYTAILKERLNQADSTKQHRTQHNEESYDVSRGSVKLFQRQPDMVIDTAGSPGSQESVSRIGKRIRTLDELPQRESRAASSAGATRSLDDALMEILVNKDSGWPLQQLSKAVKDAGVSAPMAQLKTKLLEICVYQRRNEDTHPKYYLKSEYK